MKHMQFIAKNKRQICKPKHYHYATYYSCSYVVNFMHACFMETDLHLQISQHQASLKQENFTLSYHRYTTAKHFAATATFYLYTTASTI